MSGAEQNTFHISNSSVTNMTGSGDIQVNLVSQAQAKENRPCRRILFLAANPISTSRLRLDEEIREIESGLQRSKYRDRFDIKQQWALRPRDMQRALLDYKPQIVHFSGHGVGQRDDESLKEENSKDEDAAGVARKIIALNSQQPPEEGLILEDAAGQPKRVSTAAVAALFGLFSASVECVILNACYSERQARAIAQHIPYVIGMNQAIGDRAAIAFAVGFYDALGAGEPYKSAYQSGCVAVQMENIPEHLTPTIIASHSSS